MKILSKLILLIYVALAIFPMKLLKANASVSVFARIVADNTMLFSSQDKKNAIFILPNSYFVELLSQENDCYYVKYNGIFGYVLKDQVKAIIGQPSVPYLTNISFRIFVPSGASLRLSPQNNGAVNLICTIPFLDSNISYIGSAIGEEAISKKGNIWYYCTY